MNTSSESRSLRVLLWGFGHMNKLILRYVTEKNHTVVGVVGRHNVGESAFQIAGLERFLSEERHKNLNITGLEGAEHLIQKTKPDICVLATRSIMNDVHETLRVLGSHGVNVITICEEAFYSWNTARQITTELDSLFKQNNVSFTGSGAQDVYWGLLPACVLGSSHTVNRIKGLVQFNVDDYGKALCELHGVGMSQEEFATKISSSQAPSYIWNSNEWLANSMGWQVKSMKQDLLPVVLDKEIHSKTFNGNIAAGSASGMKAVVVTECENGIVIETEMIGTVYHGDMFDVCSWTVQGEPNTELVVNRPATVEITCASVVNRLQQVVNARSGYVPTYELGLAPWKK
jgi:2,4-diaminopentanoate dehydrogenase